MTHKTFLEAFRADIDQAKTVMDVLSIVFDAGAAKYADHIGDVAASLSRKRAKEKIEHLTANG